MSSVDAGCPDRLRLVADLAAGGESRRRALEVIVHLAPEARSALIDDTLAGALVATLTASQRSQQRAAADTLATLVETVPPLVAALERALTVPEQRLRWGAAYTLGHSCARSAAIWPAVREAMALEDGDQRWAAAELACLLARDDPEVRHGIESAASAPDTTVRKMALYCLRDLAPPVRVELALGALADGDAGVRLAALALIVRVTGREARRRSAARVAEMVESDPSPGVRRAAAAALGRLGVASPSVLEALARAESNPDRSLARAAAAARRELGGQTV